MVVCFVTVPYDLLLVVSVVTVQYELIRIWAKYFMGGCWFPWFMSSLVVGGKH